MEIHVKQQMMHYLAGYAVESKLAPPEAVSWLDKNLEEGEWEDSDGEDLNKAVHLAKRLCGDNGHVWRMVRRMASWTDEALSHPRLWAVVEALSEQLLTVKTRMCGKRARRIMDKAWGENPLLPYMEMGQLWRRRFPLQH